MLKDLVSQIPDANTCVTIGLVIFFVVFVSVALATALRSRTEIVRCSRLPLGEDESEVRS